MTKPSQLIKFESIPVNAKVQAVNGSPEEYYWYKENGIYYPHRKPAVSETLRNKFK